MHKLVISDDEGKTTVVPLVRDEITIGRKEGNTIRLTERNVSRRHARLKKANGAYLIEDLESYNGIKVNGRRIEKELELKLGDQVGIGDYMIALQDEAADATNVAEVQTAAITPALRHAAVADSPTAMIAAPAAPVAPPPPARLVMISPPAPGAEFAFQKAKMRVGRAEDLDICVNHRSISREHAELAREGNRIRLLDLGSANGTRVNGQDVTDTLLAPGDVIELGQVRFRYVGEGETYHFDAERTVQMDALVMPTPTSRVPMVIGAAIVAVALIGTCAFVAMTGGDPVDDGIQATAVPTGGGPIALPAVAASPPLSPSDVAYTSALAACHAALAGGQLDQALTQAQAALGYRPGDPEASACQQSATLAIDQQVAADAQSLVDRAHAALPGNPDEATRLARELMTMPNASPSARADAQGVIAQAQALRDAARPVGTGVRPVGIAGTVVAIRPAGGGGGGGGARPGGNGNPVATGGTSRPGGGGQVVAPAGGGGGGGGRPLLGPDEGAAARIDRARDLMIAGNNNGVIALLQNGRSQQELELLIATYQNVGNTPAKLAAMQRYVDRFPTTARARGYQQVLLRQQ